MFHIAINLSYLISYLLFFLAAMTLVLVVCVGFFMFMLIVGVFRVYTTRKVNKALDDKQDMDWDDGPLNITVNPMDGVRLSST